MVPLYKASLFTQAFTPRKGLQAGLATLPLKDKTPGKSRGGHEVRNAIIPHRVHGAENAFCNAKGSLYLLCGLGGDGDHSLAKGPSFSPPFHPCVGYLALDPGVEESVGLLAHLLPTWSRWAGKGDRALVTGLRTHTQTQMSRCSQKLSVPQWG